MPFRRLARWVARGGVEGGSSGAGSSGGDGDGDDDSPPESGGSGAAAVAAVEAASRAISGGSAGETILPASLNLFGTVLPPSLGGETANRDPDDRALARAFSGLDFEMGAPPRRHSLGSLRFGYCVDATAGSPEAAALAHSGVDVEPAAVVPAAITPPDTDGSRDTTMDASDGAPGTMKFCHMVIPPPPHLPLVKKSRNARFVHIIYLLTAGGCTGASRGGAIHTSLDGRKGAAAS